MARTSDTLETIFVLLKQLEARVLGLKHMRAYVGKGEGLQTLEPLIEQSEERLTEVKRRLIQ